MVEVRSINENNCISHIKQYFKILKRSYLGINRKRSNTFTLKTTKYSLNKR
jgi:hypothetical protein